MSDRFYYERGKNHYTIFDRKSAGGDHHGMYYVAIARDVDTAETLVRLLNTYHAAQDARQALAAKRVAA